MSLLLAVAPACATGQPVHRNAVLLNGLAALALASGDRDEAGAKVALALEYAPHYAEAWVNMGLVELSRGATANAERCFLRAQNLDDGLPAADVGLGAIAEARGDDEAALRFYQHALHLDPGLTVARVNLARLLQRLDRLEEARRELRKAWAAQRSDAVVLLALGTVLLRLGRHPELQALLQEAALRLPNAPELLLLRARLALHEAHYAEAVAVLDTLASRSDPLGLEALRWLLVADDLLGDCDAMAATAARLSAASPQDAFLRRYQPRCQHRPR